MRTSESVPPAPGRLESARVIGLPERTEAPPYYFKYIDRISGGDVLEELANQRGQAIELFSGISEEKSLHRYAPEKWSIRLWPGGADPIGPLMLTRRR